MASAIFLKIDGIKGESQDHAHKEELDVQSWSWGMSQTASTHSGGGSGTGKATVNDIQFHHYVDKSSPNLMQYCLTGKHIDNALLTLRKASGEDKGFDFLTIKLTDLLISSVQVGSSGGDERPVESFSLNFAKVEVEYQEQDQKGAAKGGPVKAGYDVKLNKKV